MKGFFNIRKLNKRKPAVQESKGSIFIAYVTRRHLFKYHRLYKPSQIAQSHRYFTGVFILFMVPWIKKSETFQFKLSDTETYRLIACTPFVTHDQHKSAWEKHTGHILCVIVVFYWFQMAAQMLCQKIK